MERHFLKLKELTAYDNAMFPLSIYNVISDTSQTNRIHCHWHEEIEILMVTKGCASLYLNNKCTAISQGNVVLMPSNQLHLATCPVGEAFSFISIVFHPTLLIRPTGDIVQQQYIDPILHPNTIFPVLDGTDSDWQEQVRQLLHEIQELFLHKDFEYEMLIRTRLYQIWHLYSMHFNPNNKAAKANSNCRIDMTRDIIEYIREHYDGSILLKDIARQFHLSREYLCRFFKSMTRMSPIEYLTLYRISMSMELLLHTNAEICDIAMRTGFNNASYFSLTFQKYMHTTPSQYREDYETGLLTEFHDIYIVHK